MRTLTAYQAAAAAALPDRWLRPVEAAYLLSVGVRTLWRLTAKGKIPAPVRFSRKLVRFDRAALIDHLRGAAVAPRERTVP
jgi:excisionase family DNA binding protein